MSYARRQAEALESLVHPLVYAAWFPERLGGWWYAHVCDPLARWSLE
jgi:hypothetical protein